jgi:hypothetical protein
MKKIIFFCGLLFILSFISSCKSNFYTLKDGSKCKQVKIIDPGELYSTYCLGKSPRDQYELLAQGISNGQLLEICNYSLETAYPMVLTQLEQREKLWEQMKKYNAYLVGNFSDKCVLVIPASRNQRIPKYLIPDKDIYFIMGTNGIKE